MIYYFAQRGLTTLHLRPQLSSIRARFGYPYHQWMAQEFDEQGWHLVERSVYQKRTHDVTMLIEGVDGRFALMSKHSYPPGIFRSPSGGVKLGEDLAAGALREAKEETGLAIDLKRFLLHITLDIRFQDELTTWESYIFHATTKDTLLKPTDLKEVKDTQWVAPSQMQAMIAKLKGTGNGGLIYRGDLTAASLWALDNKLTIREAVPRDMSYIQKCLLMNKMDMSKVEETLWWIAEVNGIASATVGMVSHPDCVELTGLTVESMYKGKGLGHAAMEYACDQWRDVEKRKKFAETKKLLLNDKLWLVTSTPGYFLPVNFVMADTKVLPKSLKDRLVGDKAKWTGMRYQLYSL